MMQASSSVSGQIEDAAVVAAIPDRRAGPPSASIGNRRPIPSLLPHAYDNGDSVLV